MLCLSVVVASVPGCLWASVSAWAEGWVLNGLLLISVNLSEALRTCQGLGWVSMLLLV